MTFRQTLSGLWTNIQQKLFPLVENYTGQLSPQYKELSAVLEVIGIEEVLVHWKNFIGRPRYERDRFARAYIAKAFLQINYTKELVNRLKSDKQLRMLCGWEENSKIPSESSFSRVFNELAETNFPDMIHQILVKQLYHDKIIGHLVKDSTPISVREKALKKEGTYKERKKEKNARYVQEKKGEIQSRRGKQLGQSLEEMLKDLPIGCDVGVKKNAQGFGMAWKGYKLHVAIDDHCLPISAVLTSASLNDCEAAIPLATKADKVAKNFYDLMDSAYDVEEVKKHSCLLGHIPIIDKHCRSKDQKSEKDLEEKAKRIINVPYAEDVRYKKRMPAERFNALLKDNYLAKGIYYKGYPKVFCHLMFSVLTLTASTMLQLLI